MRPCGRASRRAETRPCRQVQKAPQTHAQPSTAGPAFKNNTSPVVNLWISSFCAQRARKRDSQPLSLLCLPLGPRAFCFAQKHSPRAVFCRCVSRAQRRRRQSAPCPHLLQLGKAGQAIHHLAVGLADDQRAGVGQEVVGQAVAGFVDPLQRHFLFGIGHFGEV